MGTVLALAVACRSWCRGSCSGERVIRFPWRGGGRWTRTQWIYLVGHHGRRLADPAVLLHHVGRLPELADRHRARRDRPPVRRRERRRHWDELFFICTVFTLLRRHFPTWQANLLQTIVFVSFLWELGYQIWGPLLTIPFALMQGYTFKLTKSLTYVLIVHLLFDLFVFLVIVYAHTGVPPIFLLAP